MMIKLMWISLLQMLKSDYFRIEIKQSCINQVYKDQLKSDYFRIEIKGDL